MSRIEMFPKDLLSPDKAEEVVLFIQGIPGRYIDRKELLCDWCSFVDYPLTPELVQRVFSG